MKAWNIWKKFDDNGEILDIEAIPRGFSIPAFLFSWLWGLFIKGLRKRSFLYAIFTSLIPDAIIFYSALHSRGLGKGQDNLFYFLALAVGVIALMVQIQYGWSASRWRNEALKCAGYAPEDHAVLAKTSAKAMSGIAQPVREGYQSPNHFGVVFTVVWCALFILASVASYPAKKSVTSASAYRLGALLVRHGKTVQGLALIRSEAHKGNPQAELYWSSVLLFGEYGVHKNLPDAIHWTELAAKNGDMGRALTRLGYFIAIGDVPGGKIRAITLWQRASSMGYTNDIQVIRRYPWDADIWGAKLGNRQLWMDLVRAAKSGQPIAAYYVGRQEISRHPAISFASYNPAQAIQLFRVSAHKGFYLGEYELAQSYGFGWDHQPIQDEKADYWWYKSAREGENLAANNLGYSYEIGDGVKKNLVLAAYWFDIGLNYGYKPDKNKLSRVYSQLSPAQKLYFHHILLSLKWPVFDE